jgi:hypothetical protein
MANRFGATIEVAGLPPQNKSRQAFRYSIRIWLL